MQVYAQWLLRRAVPRTRRLAQIKARLQRIAGRLPILAVGYRVLRRIIAKLTALVRPLHIRDTATAAATVRDGGRVCIPASYHRFVTQPSPGVSGGKLKVAHCIGSLNAGGAERQLCNLAVATPADQYELSLITLHDLAGERGHYLPLLAHTRIDTRIAGAVFHPTFEERIAQAGLEPLLHEMPGELQPTVELVGEFVTHRPDIVHAWLDHTNIWAGVAALLADVPIVILSMRNVNPTHFPYLAHPWLRPWYQWLAKSPRVYWINNSAPGARDYAHWLDLPASRIHVIRNGVDLDSLPEPSPNQVAAFRQSLHLKSADRLLLGAFRLSEEKQPLTFVTAAAQAMRDLPDLHVAIAGVGPMQREVHDAIKACPGVADRFHLLGRRSDMPTLIAAADALMLTSRQEGTPNIVLEAQALACPVIATRAGGTVDCVDHERTGLLVEVGDVEALTRSVTTLFTDESLRRRLAAASPAFVRERFAVKRMAEETLAVYQNAIAQANGSQTAATT
jgi:glycosyltransferase involved in cell wall biosynthesis